ncbi:MAG: prepilin-type N-terminal cleavage/methylation domain-containing protein [Candidatus Omnitrophica bacterium]|nr:prepilin-type N-terminal cleavage/methylation domain-containing protein [Candidatus Omnitrophota bacterium]
MAGFTLVELIVVIIIVGILAAVGLTQYSKTVEKGRVAEAKKVLGVMRQHGWDRYMEVGSFSDQWEGWDINPDNSGGIPYSCRSSHYFYYRVSGEGASGFTGTATRCTSLGKSPQGSSAYTITINVTPTGDTWGGTGP